MEILFAIIVLVWLAVLHYKLKQQQRQYETAIHSVWDIFFQTGVIDELIYHRGIRTIKNLPVSPRQMEKKRKAIEALIGLDDDKKS